MAVHREHHLESVRRMDLVGDGASLCAGRFRCVLGKGGRDEGGDDPAPALAGMGQHAVDPAALPRLRRIRR